MTRTKLKVLRARRNWSQKDVADKLGITPASYSLIENGKRLGANRTWEKIKSLYKLKDREMWEIQHEGMEAKANGEAV